MYDKFGVKDLYEVSLKTTDNIEINNRAYERDEVFMFFDNLQISNISAEGSTYEASGGKNNFSWLMWEKVKSVDFVFEDGLASMVGFNLLTQSDASTKGSITVPKREFVITNSSGIATLENNVSTDRSIFAYKTSGGVIIEKLTIVGTYTNTIDLGVANANTSILVDYYFANTNITHYEIGGENIKGFFKMTSKINFVDEKDGLKTTVLFVMPKVRILSNLNLTLGARANPIVSAFRLRAFPDDSGKSLARFIYLNQDIEG